MSNTAKEKIVAETLTWIGTPYQHQARVKHVGVDCAQLMAGVAEGAGLMTDIQVPTNYTASWNINNPEEKMLEILEDLGCKRTETPEPGDIIAFKIGRAHGHLGIIVSETEFVHAELQGSTQGTRNGEVVRVHMTGDWARRSKIYYTFPHTETI